MKIAVFGSTGNIGRLLVEQALAEGYDVVAYARSPAKLTIKHDRLTIVQGELSDEAKIGQAIDGVDAVLSALGPTRNTKGNPITHGTEHIIAAMEKHGVRRLIATSNEIDPKDKPGITIKSSMLLLKLAWPGAYADMQGWPETIRSSGLDWTLARFMALGNKPKTGHVRAGYAGRDRLGLMVSRADLADFMLRQVKETKYIRQAPLITN